MCDWPMSRLAVLVALACAVATDASTALAAAKTCPLDFPFPSPPHSNIICYNTAAFASAGSGTCGSWCTQDVAIGSGCGSNVQRICAESAPVRAASIAPYAAFCPHGGMTHQQFFFQMFGFGSGPLPADTSRSACEAYCNTEADCIGYYYNPVGNGQPQCIINWNSNANCNAKCSNFPGISTSCGTHNPSHCWNCATSCGGYGGKTFKCTENTFGPCSLASCQKTDDGRGTQSYAKPAATTTESALIRAAKIQVEDSKAWFKHNSENNTAWSECSTTFCKYEQGETEVFSHSSRDETHYLRRSNGPIDRSIQSRNRAKLNDNRNFGDEHWHCEQDSSHADGCKCMCSDDTNCYSVKHSDRFVKKCDGQDVTVQYTASKNHKDVIAAIDAMTSNVHVTSAPTSTPTMLPTDYPTLAPTLSLGCDPAEAAGYTLVSSVGIPTLDDNWDTAAHFASALIANPGMPAENIERVAYCMKLGDQWVWTSFDQTDKNKIGVPTDYMLDTTVANLNVYGSDGTSVTGSNNGKVEFWDQCYAETGGNNGAFDHDDSPVSDDCYGSMQVHDGTTTEFGFNGWSHGSYCDVTIGNAAGTHTDGTYLNNCNSYNGDGVSAISTYVKVA
jgi:hypothetical protein